MKIFRLSSQTNLNEVSVGLLGLKIPSLKKTGPIKTWEAEIYTCAIITHNPVTLLCNHKSQHCSRNEAAGKNGPEKDLIS